MGYEYKRLERRFRFPKLCAIAAMRDAIPGVGVQVDYM
jgi:hypothetical protein